MGRPKQSFPPPARRSGEKMRCWWQGRYHYLGPVDDPTAWQSEYARLCRVWADDPHAAPLSPDEYLVSSLFRDYLASADSPPGGSPREWVGVVAALLLDYHPDAAVAGFGPVDFKAFQRWACTLPSLKDPAKTRFNATSIGHVRTWVKAVWKWGVLNRGVSAERWQALRAVPPPKIGECRPGRSVPPANPADVVRVLDLLPPAPRAVVSLLRLTGGRPSELLSIRPGDLDRSGDVWLYTPRKHKGTWRGKARTLYLNADAQAVLIPWLDGCGPNDLVFTPARSEAVRRPGAKPRRSAASYNHRSLNRAVRRACESAGVKFTPYMLRHLVGAEVRRDHGLEAARAMLGHSHKSMTDHYSRSADKELAERVVRGKTGG